MKFKFGQMICVLFLLVSLPLHAQGVNARYPDRLPDWLWDVPEYQHLLTVEEVWSIRADIERLKKLQEKKAGQVEAVQLEADIAKRLASKFSSRDLYNSAYVSHNSTKGLSLALRLDPAFDSNTAATLRTAVDRFLFVALDADVIGLALKRSSPKPEPMPPIYEKQEDGQLLNDELGRSVFTGAYSLYLLNRVIPSSAEAFATHLKSSLTTHTGDPRVLVISSYSGNAAKNFWWGGGKYGFLSDPLQQLQRESVPEGYLYIRLNLDKFNESSFGWNDPNFWASKIAHEVLHNLWYWHPDYASPAERDKFNQGDNRAFVVSYEAAIYEKLKALE